MVTVTGTGTGTGTGTVTGTGTGTGTGSVIVVEPYQRVTSHGHKLWSQGSNTRHNHKSW